jgi:hypothetical protein
MPRKSSPVIAEAANVKDCPVCGQSYDWETDAALCDCTTAEKTLGVELQQLQNKIQNCEFLVASIRSALMRIVANRREREALKKCKSLS